MKEQIIDFKTAKLAKEKGFNEYCDLSYYNSENELHKDINHRNSDYVWLPSSYQRFSTPTQSLLQKWVREVHRISIIIPYACGYSITFNLLSKEGECKYPNQKLYDTYEEALEEALLEALKLMKL